MSDITTIPPVDPECAAHEALKSAAHSRPIWITKPDGTKVNLAELLCCMVEALGEAAEPMVQKPLIRDGYMTRDGCEPVWIEYPCNDTGGYDYSSPTAYTIDPATGVASVIPVADIVRDNLTPLTDTEDLTPFIIPEGAALTVADIITQALAASSVTAFSQEGSALTVAQILEKGDIRIESQGNRNGMTENGGAKQKTYEDTNGIDGASVIEAVNGDLTARVCTCITYFDKG